MTTASRARLIPAVTPRLYLSESSRPVWSVCTRGLMPIPHEMIDVKATIGLRRACTTVSQRVGQLSPTRLKVEFEPDRHAVPLKHPIPLTAKAGVEVTPKSTFGRIHRFHGNEMCSVPLRFLTILTRHSILDVRVVIVVVSISLRSFFHRATSQEFADFRAVSNQTAAVVRGHAPRPHTRCAAAEEASRAKKNQRPRARPRPSEEDEGGGVREQRYVLGGCLLHHD